MMKTVIAAVICGVLPIWGAACGEKPLSDRPIRIGGEALLPDHPRSHFSRNVNDAPVDGETVHLNPPRMRWTYNPDGYGGGLFQFVFQIAADAKFTGKIVDVTTPYNFYNTLAPLPGEGPFYWRVGYIEGPTAKGRTPSRWSPVRAFKIAPGAVVWDRSMLAEPDFSKRPHPRILLSDANLPKIRRHIQTDPAAAELFESIRAKAGEAMRSQWYRDFPATDRGPRERGRFLRIAKGLCHVAFMHRLTGERKYASVVQRAATLASYPKGGAASPEPMGDSSEDSTQITELLALMYDWLWPDLTAGQRKTFVEALRWRIDYFVNHFAWKKVRQGKRIVPRYGSLSTICESHSFEGFWDTFPAALASYEDTPEARECFHLGVNWLVGVSSSHGQDEGWNEGPKYSTSKLQWLVHGSVYLDSAFPEFKLGSHPWWGRVAEWFSRVTPVGVKYSPWGHGSNNCAATHRWRAQAFGPMAYLSGNGVMLRNRRESGGVKVDDTRRPWIQLAVPALHPRPAEALEKDPVGLFPLAGWVMVGTKPPSSAEAYKTSVGMIFQCRPVGAYSHSFASDNSFHIYGYGEDLSFAAGASGAGPYSYHSMSHNTILIDGLGQNQRGHYRTTSRLGFIRAFARGDGYVYWAGDATDAYPKRPARAGGFWGRLDEEIYGRRDARHLQRFIRHVVFLRGKYFIIFDDLAAERPTRFTWLYHILPHDPIRVDEQTWTIDYKVGRVPVRIVHAANRGDLELIDMQGADGFKNPLTGEDYTTKLGRVRRRSTKFLVGHNLYLSNRTKAKEFHFLSVMAPVRPGEEPPAIRRLDDWTVQVGKDVVTFDPNSPHKADLIIDVPALRAKSPKLPRFK